MIVTQAFAATAGSVQLDPGVAPAPPVDTSGDTPFDGTPGADRIEGLGSADSITGNAGNDTLLGAKGSDTLRGGTGDDRVIGQGGHDKLFGDDGRDTLTGGWGNDTLNGGEGNDRLKGQAGADIFVFNPGDDVDRIADFEDELDRIDLRAFDFATPQEAMQMAVARNGHVVFDFGDGDRLVVENTILAHVTDDLLI